MKKKLDKATRKKIILAVVIIAGLICGYKIIDAASYQFVKTKAEIYLCIKYDAKPSEIELVDYKHSGIYWDDYNIFYLTPKWTDFSFEFKYNDRNFIVNREKGRFYDDYQLDEIEKWCTEWLKENVDERIIGIQLDSADVVWYQDYYRKGRKYILTENDTEDFLNCYTFNEIGDQHYLFFYYDKNVDKRFHADTNEEILIELHKYLNLYDKSYVNYLDTFLIKKNYKGVEERWKYYYYPYNKMKNNS